MSDRSSEDENEESEKKIQTEDNEIESFDDNLVPRTTYRDSVGPPLGKSRRSDRMSVSSPGNEVVLIKYRMK